MKIQGQFEFDSDTGYLSLRSLPQECNGLDLSLYLRPVPALCCGQWQGNPNLSGVRLTFDRAEDGSFFLTEINRD